MLTEALMTYVRKPAPTFQEMLEDEAVMDVSRWKLRNGDDSTPENEVKFARKHVKRFFKKARASLANIQMKKGVGGL